MNRFTKKNMNKKNILKFQEQTHTHTHSHQQQLHLENLNMNYPYTYTENNNDNVIIIIDREYIKKNETKMKIMNKCPKSNHKKKPETKPI